MRKFIRDKSFNDYIEISEIDENTGDMLTYCKDRETGIEYHNNSLPGMHEHGEV